MFVDQRKAEGVPLQPTETFVDSRARLMREVVRVFAPVLRPDMTVDEIAERLTPDFDGIPYDFAQRVQTLAYRIENRPDYRCWTNTGANLRPAPADVHAAVRRGMADTADQQRARAENNRMARELLGW